MRFLILLVMLVSSAAALQDLSGKVFTFPQQTNTAHVRLNSTKLSFSAATVCHRSFTDLKRNYGLFSLSTPANSNAFLIYYDFTNQEIESFVKNAATEYGGLDYKPNTWYSICTTWDSSTGLVQVWFNGQPLSRRYLNAESIITGSTSIILGQEQDSHGGGFEIKQSFVGMMTDVHMWDYVLSSCEIQKYVAELNFTPGNALNWAAMDFQIIGRVLIENKETTCQFGM